MKLNLKLVNELLSKMDGNVNRLKALDRKLNISVKDEIKQTKQAA